MGRKENTVEELLKEALVPVEEQPYEVPGNWVWSRFGSSCGLYNGYAFKSDDYVEKGIAVIRISDIDGQNINLNNAVRVPKNQFNERYMVKKGDFLIAMSGATTGKYGIYNCDEIALQNQRVGNVKVLYSNVINDKYKNYFMIHSKNKILDLAYGGAQPNISAKLIENLEFPIPPLQEQQRIVNKIESLFFKIDKAKELIEEAREGFENRKAAILAKAFRGELTKNWREKNAVLGPAKVLLEKIKKERFNKYTNEYAKAEKLKLRKSMRPRFMDNEAYESPEANILGCWKECYIYEFAKGPYALPQNWRWVKIEDVIEKMKTKKPSQIKGEHFYYIDIEAIDNKRQRIRRMKLLSLEQAPSRASRDVQEGDVLIFLVRPYLKNVALVESDRDDLIASTGFYVCRTKSIYNHKLLYYYLITDSFTNTLTGLMKGDNSQSIRISEFPEQLIPLMPIEEQQEIVCILDKLLESESKTEELTQLEEQIERLKRAILAKAFRGKLSTNDPAEEGALGLLKEVLADKIK